MITMIPGRKQIAINIISQLSCVFHTVILQYRKIFFIRNHVLTVQDYQFTIILFQLPAASYQRHR